MSYIWFSKLFLSFSQSFLIMEEELGGGYHWGFFFVFHRNIEPAMYYLAVAQDCNMPNTQGYNR